MHDIKLNNNKYNWYDNKTNKAIIKKNNIISKNTEGLFKEYFLCIITNIFKMNNMYLLFTDLHGIYIYKYIFIRLFNLNLVMNTSKCMYL